MLKLKVEVVNAKSRYLLVNVRNIVKKCRYLRLRVKGNRK
jgi:hypothetical protein